jgi:photosystem II stability/assembly factor-like uncharacterized protein
MMTLRAISLVICAAAAFRIAAIRTDRVTTEGPMEARDNEWFMLQRSYPGWDLDPHLYYRARIQARLLRGTLLPETANVPWELVGPSNIGGRITSLALHPGNSDIIYAGAAAGGVWKSTDGALSWYSVFNEAPSIGSLLLHPSDPEVLYVGTGEANPGGVAIYPGNGLWKSTDGGGAWTLLGLENTGHIGKIAIHPSAPDRIFAAALGRYRSRTTDRGIYRSEDGGTTWERVLFINDTTGACDVLIDPANNERIIAATWTRYRPVTYSIISGTGSGLWLSTDGGDSWSQITNGYPSNDASLGRTALAVAPSLPSTMYALSTTGVSPRGIYKSTNSGTSWSLVAGSGPFGGEGQVWYNNVIAVDPSDPNRVLAGMTDMYRSTNGGTSWSSVLGSMHVDHHAIEFDASTSGRVVVGNDGGVFTSVNGGSSWIKSFNLPVTQFYAGTLDFTNPLRYYGGTQDNGTMRTMTGSIDDWSVIYGGDGFYCLVDPTNPNRIYVESQYAGLGYSTNGGASFQSGRTSGFGTGDRTNWNTPIAMDINNPLTLYAGTYRVYKTTNGMASWTAISSDLTRGQNGRIGTLTTIAVAESDPAVIYTGADDGTVSVTQNGGTTWTNITGNLPVRWVTRVSVHPDSANVAYVTQSGYLQDDFQSHIHKTTDFGETWNAIGLSLPDIPVNDIIIDPDLSPYLYIATDVGVMASPDGGTSWTVLGEALPESPVHDLTLHSPARTLLASTHGRSAFTFDLASLTEVPEVAASVPRTYLLLSNYPNPFNPGTDIEYRMTESGRVTLRIYDLPGREIATLVDRVQTAGEYRVRWNAGAQASGVYLAVLSTSAGTAARKMLLVK